MNTAFRECIAFCTKIEKDYSYHNKFLTKIHACKTNSSWINKFWYSQLADDQILAELSAIHSLTTFRYCYHHFFRLQYFLFKIFYLPICMLSSHRFVYLTTFRSSRQHIWYICLEIIASRQDNTRFYKSFSFEIRTPLVSVVHSSAIVKRHKI